MCAHLCRPHPGDIGPSEDPLVKDAQDGDGPGLEGQWVNSSAQGLETHHPACSSPFFKVVLSELPGAANKTSPFLSGEAS